jgi:hypothetical protein
MKAPWRRWIGDFLVAPKHQSNNAAARGEVWTYTASGRLAALFVSRIEPVGVGLELGRLCALVDLWHLRNFRL